MNCLHWMKIGVLACVWSAVALMGCDRPAPSDSTGPATTTAADTSRPRPAPRPDTPSFFGGQNPPPAQSATAAPQQNVEGPVITFETDAIDFGTISEVEKRQASFKFTNSGNQTLIIHQVKTTCGCTSAQLAKKQYQPGESGQIDITLDKASPGNSPKLVNVISNAEPDPLSRLTINADVLPFIDIQPRILNTGIMAYRTEHHFTVTISCPQDEGYTIESITTTNPHASARVAADSSAGNTRIIEITIAPSATWGSFFSWLDVTARAKPAPDAQPVSHTSKIRIQGQVFGELQAEPDTFRFGVKPGMEFIRTMRLHRPAGPFELRSASVQQADIPGTSITAKKLAPNEYELTLHAVADQLRPLASGKVVVVTDIPGEERLEIPIVGVVRVDDPSVR